ncbi:MAG: hypothetical protein BEU04_02570 [Marine Group III euryarchaeote CG-Bathy1]|uniref:Uncharacterized protein n=1 Tax=Marine Group III euryarchaeote CG-Bathy1 TaxID=1889001 RepID=A0A1J5T1P6_9ARCH|nr:MAG: hypothetical protein BEU04_02570 [Marine Group III euryarchaeote CG-Bathy1]
MEKIAYEGLGRLMIVDGSLKTPLILNCEEGATLLPTESIEKRSSIKIGNKEYETPDLPLGVDSETAPYLSTSEKIAVIDYASVRRPEKILNVIENTRNEVGYNRLVYAHSVEPIDMPLLVYLGVDIFDNLALSFRTASGFALEEGEWVKDDSKNLEKNNQEALSTWIKRIRRYLKEGRLREMVEKTSLHNPRNAEILRKATQILEHTGGEPRNEIKANTFTLKHPSILSFQKKMENFLPPTNGMVLLLLPCSAKKPYHWSKSHKRFRSVLSKISNHLMLHQVIVTSPLGVVPRELELFPPAAHYDIAVTGDWDEDEKKMLKKQIERLNIKKNYSNVIIHAGEISEFLEQTMDEMGIKAQNTGAKRPASDEGLKILKEIVEKNLENVERLTSKERSKGEAQCVAKFQFGDYADKIMKNKVNGKWPKLSIENVGSVSTRIGGFALNCKGAEMLTKECIGIVEGADFELKGDMFAAGVMGTKGDWKVGDQVAIEQKGEITGVGIAFMNPKECMEMENGLAVEVRNRA